MRRLDKESSRQRTHELRALWNEWDPIGVICESNQDEYDAYVGETLHLLADGASHCDISNWLAWVVGEHMGLGNRGVASTEPHFFARRVIDWYESNWPDTVG